jgi:hypothetical protein
VEVTKFCISLFCVRCSKPRVFLNDPVYISLIHITYDPTWINIPLPWPRGLVTDVEALVGTGFDGKSIFSGSYFFYLINLKDNIIPCSTDLTKNILIQCHCQEIVAIYLQAHICHVGAMLKYCVLATIQWKKIGRTELYFQCNSWNKSSCLFEA